MKTLYASIAVACLSFSAFASAQPKGAPSPKAIKTAVSEKFNGVKLSDAKVNYTAPGTAIVKTMQFAGGPIRQGHSDMALENFAKVSYQGKIITSIEQFDRGVMPLTMPASPNRP